MADVGAVAGVTDRTVSNVLSGKVPVSPRTRQAVLQAVEDLGYQMNVSARSLRTGQTGFLTVALPDLTIDYFAELADEILAESDRLGWSVILQRTDGDRQREVELLAGSKVQFSDGLLLHPHALVQADQNLLVTDLPVVLIGEQLHDVPVDHVTMANTAAARAATAHLISLGRRRILALGPDPDDPSHTSAVLRFEGYRQALGAAGIAEDPELIGPSATWNEAHGARVVEAVLDRGVSFDSVFCFNDSLAFGALHVLSRRGISVPGEVAVIGFDNVTAASYANPPLTSVDPEVGTLARTAVQRLVGRICGTYDDPPSEFATNFSIVRRSST